MLFDVYQKKNNNKLSNILWTTTDVMRKALLLLLFCQSSYFLNIIAESIFGELMDLLNYDRLCSFEVVWIFKDINLIIESSYYDSFVSVPLKCNRASTILSLTC